MKKAHYYAIYQALHGPGFIDTSTELRRYDDEAPTTYRRSPNLSTCAHVGACACFLINVVFA